MWSMTDVPDLGWRTFDGSGAEETAEGGMKADEENGYGVADEVSWRSALGSA